MRFLGIRMDFVNRVSGRIGAGRPGLGISYRFRMISFGSYLFEFGFCCFVSIQFESSVSVLCVKSINFVYRFHYHQPAKPCPSVDSRSSRELYRVYYFMIHYTLRVVRLPQLHRKGGLWLGMRKLARSQSRSISTWLGTRKLASSQSRSLSTWLDNRK